MSSADPATSARAEQKPARKGGRTGVHDRPLAWHLEDATIDVENADVLRANLLSALALERQRLGLTQNDRAQRIGANLVTVQKFDDFKLHLEVRVPKESNSGVYLRGRYELQVDDAAGLEPSSHHLGGLYGFIAPSESVAKPAGEWQSMDVTLVGRMLTYDLNGTNVICNREIPGITGGAIDSVEADPGPILLQGDHGAVDYRNIVITPANSAR